MEIPEILPFVAGIVSFLVAGGLVFWIMKQLPGTKEMMDILNAVKERAARDGRNPQTGATIKISAAKLPVAQPGAEHLVIHVGRQDQDFVEEAHCLLHGRRHSTSSRAFSRSTSASEVHPLV